MNTSSSTMLPPPPIEETPRSSSLDETRREPVRSLPRPVSKEFNPYIVDLNTLPHGQFSISFDGPEDSAKKGDFNSSLTLPAPNKQFSTSSSLFVPQPLLPPGLFPTSSRVVICENCGAAVDCRKHKVKKEKEIMDLSQPVTFPDGGLRAWMVVVGVWITQFCSFGYTNSYGVYNDYYVRTYLSEKYTSSQISWIGSVQLFLVLSVGILTGRAFDMGHFYPLMIGGSFLLVFCLFMLSITQPQQLWQVFILQGVGIGLAIGIMYIPGVGILSHYFLKRRALVVGIATSGSALGGLAHPIMLNKWFHGSLGFHNGVRASAGLNGGLLLIAIFLMKPRLAPRKESRIGTIESFRVFLRDGPYVLTICGTVFVCCGLFYPIFFLQLNSIKNGINPNLAFYTIAILNGSSTFGRILPALFVYRFGVFNVIIPCVTIAGILVFCTLAVTNAPGTIVFAILYGFFSGAYASLLPPMMSSLSRHDYEIGARMGVCFVFTGFGGLIGTPISGALLTTNFIWLRPILFSGLCVVMGASCFMGARFFTARRKGTQFV